MRYQVSIIVGTDSHVSSAIGDFTQADELLREADFPAELIVNADPGRIGDVVNIL